MNPLMTHPYGLSDLAQRHARLVQAANGLVVPLLGDIHVI
jgi:hypothetical protein